MTGPSDLDRALASFLDEGPWRAPDRPVDAALAHARAHPRRRDPFGTFRRDPMGRRTSSAMRPALVLATLLLLAALSAAVYIGSRPQQPAIVPPSQATETPSASPSAPSPSPLASPTSAGPTSVELVDGNGLTTTIQIVDRSGLLVAAAGFPADPERPQSAEIEAIQLPADEGGGERAIILMWVDFSCPGPHTLTIDETARNLVLGSRPCTADAIGVDHQLVLTFSEPIRATDLVVELIRLP